MSKDEEVYQKRDQLLGEIHGEVKGMKAWREEVKDWQEDHDKKDDKRFFWLCVSIVIVAAASGVLPQLTAFAFDHFK